MKRRLTLPFSAMIALSAMMGCGAHTASVAEAVPTCHRISGEQAMRMMMNGALLVDVSERMAFYGRHLRGAHNIPLEELEERVHELPRDRPIVVYSRDGDGAPEADQLLRRQGFDVHLLGSFADWRS